MAGRKQDENLIPQSQRTKAEQRRIAKMGGKASGAARREKKTMMETLSLFLSMPLKDGDLANVDKIKSLAGARGENLSVQEGIILAQTLRALRGDQKSAALIMGIIQAEEEKHAPEENQVTIVDDFK